MSEEMAPKGWCVATIMDVAASSGGGTPSKSDPSYWDEGTIPWVSPKDMKSFLVTSSEDSVTTKALGRLTLIPSESVLVVVRSGILSRTLPVSINKIPVTVNQDMRAFVPASGVDARYIAWQLVSKERDILDRCAKDGTTVASIEGPALASYPMAIAPLNEQTRIVEKLEELLSDLDAGVAELKAAQRKLAQYRQSLLKAAVEGALTADWRAARCKNIKAPALSFPRKRESIASGNSKPVDSRFRGNDSQGKATHSTEIGTDLLQRILSERRTRWETRQLAKFAEQGKTPPHGWQSKYPEPVVPDTTDLPALPEGWVWASMGQLSLVQKYGSSAKTNEESKGVPVLRMGNIQDGELDLGVLKYLPQNHHEFPDLFLDDGDLVFNRTNSPELVGKTAVFRSQITPCSYASYLIGVKLSPRCAPEFVSAYINSAYGRQWVKSVVTQQVGQANVNGSKLAALSIPLPPTDEQAEITRLLGEQRLAAFEQETMIDRSLKQSAAQRKNILKTAFAGQLVPQDPNDEPASALLARVRAERVSGSAKHSGKNGRKPGEKA